MGPKEGVIYILDLGGDTRKTRQRDKQTRKGTTLYVLA